MRVAIVTPGLGPCGGARIIAELCVRLRERGHDAMVVGPGIQAGWLGLEPPTMPFSMARSAKPFDAVIATGHETVVPASQLQSDRYYYYVQMMEHMFYPKGGNGYNMALGSYDFAKKKGFKFTVISGWQAEWLAEKYGIVAPVISVAVNRRHFYPDGPKGDYFLVEGDNRNPAKDIECLGWRVGEVVRAKYGLKMYGFAGYRHSYADEFDKFLAVPTITQMRQMESGARFLIKASRYEGRAGAVSECMVCGTTSARAIIAGDDDVVDGYTGLRVDYDYDALLDAAETLASDAILRRTLAANGLKHTEDHLQWEPVMDKLIKYWSN